MAATTEKKDPDKTGKKENEGVFVRCVMPGKTFRRAGMVFNDQGHGIAKSALTDKQLKALEDESMLSVEHCTFKEDQSKVVIK